jgi:hypothetical protein
VTLIRQACEGKSKAQMETLFKTLLAERSDGYDSSDSD